MRKRLTTAGVLALLLLLASSALAVLDPKKVRELPSLSSSQADESWMIYAVKADDDRNMLFSELRDYLTGSISVDLTAAKTEIERLSAASPAGEDGEWGWYPLPNTVDSVCTAGTPWRKVIHGYWTICTADGVKMLDPGIMVVERTVINPSDVQAVLDAITLKSVEAEADPYGITVTMVKIKTDASSSYSVACEQWLSPTSGSGGTVATVATSASTEAESGALTASIPAGSILKANLSTTTGVKELDIWVSYYRNPWPGQ